MSYRWLALVIYLFLSSLLPAWLVRREPPCHHPVIMGFSRNNLVHVLGRGTIPLYELKRGDFVQVRGGKHNYHSIPHPSTRVYAIASWNEPTEFLSFSTTNKNNSPKPLEVTPSQLLFTYRGHTKRSVPAQNVSDTLISPTGQRIMVKRKRRTVTRRGRYIPLTTTGDLILNGVQVSCYMDTLIHLYPELMHLYLAPFRILESSWMPFLVTPEQYLETLACLDPRLMLVLFPWVCFAYGMELILQSRQSILFAIVVVSLVWAWRTRKQHHSKYGRKKAVGSK